MITTDHEITTTYEIEIDEKVKPHSERRVVEVTLNNGSGKMAAGQFPTKGEMFGLSNLKLNTIYADGMDFIGTYGSQPMRHVRHTYNPTTDSMTITLSTEHFAENSNYRKIWARNTISLENFGLEDGIIARTTMPPSEE